MTRGPLIRQGTGPAQAYEHARQQREADRKKLEQITRDSAHVPAVKPRHELTKPGDPLALRGIPAIGRNVAGAMLGTSPHGTALDADRESR